MDKNIEPFKKDVDNIKRSLEELKRDVSLSAIERKNKTETIKAQAETVRQKIQGEINSLINKSDALSIKKKADAEAILDILNKILNLHGDIINLGASIEKSSSNETSSNNTTTEAKDKNIFKRLKDWTKNQWNSMVDKKKRKTEGGTNLLRTAGFTATGIGIIGLAYKGLKALFGGNNKESEDNNTDETLKEVTEKKSFWDHGFGKALKWIGIGTATGGGLYAVIKGLFGKKTKDGTETKDETQNKTKEVADKDNEKLKNNGNVSNNTLSDLSTQEKSEMEKLVEQSKTINTINYLENSTYKKYLNIIERDLKLPRYTLECVCKKESGGKLYKNGNIIGSTAGAQGLFQFMPKTSDSYMKNNKLREKYGKTFSSRADFLRDPLATARAAGILLSNIMNEKNYNLQSALACYNRGPGNYQKYMGGKGINLSPNNSGKIKDNVKSYVKDITENILHHNSVSSGENFLSVDLGKFLWGSSSVGSGNIEYTKSNEVFLGPKLIAKNKDEIGGLGNSIMQGFQGYKQKSNFPNMDGVASKNTKTHPNKFTSESDISAYKASHPNIKSFMFYFGANTTNNSQTIGDITKRSKWLEKEGIQPILCTCIGEDNHTWLTDLNKSLINLGKENNWPVFDFAKVYNEGKIAMGGHKHPRSEGYSVMAGYINEQLNKS